MSRNYNIRKREAINRLADGDFSGVIEASEKVDAITTYKKYKPIYPQIVDSHKDRKLRNSTVVRAVKKIKNGK